jgi:hypothetical protein
MYRVEIGITYIHAYGLGTSQDPTYIGPQYKKKTMYVEITIYVSPNMRNLTVLEMALPFPVMVPLLEMGNLVSSTV